MQHFSALRAIEFLFFFLSFFFCLQMVYRMLWSTTSPGQQGTLYQLSQRVGRTRIDGDHVKRNVAACKELFEDVTDAHVLAAAMKYFGKE